MPEDAPTLTVGVPAESCPDETRVALVPAAVKPLAKAGCTVVVQAGAGTAAGFPDRLYSDAGAKIAASRDEIFQQSDIVAMVRAGGANPGGGHEDASRFKRGQILVAHLDPLSAPEEIRRLAEQGVTAYALELLPRITRAQSMDVLSSMATVAGYKAVLIAADRLHRMFPMLMTAAGTVKPARVFVMGAGVAGLQAIATAKRLGAIVYAYDVRPVVKEQVESLGARFVEVNLETEQAEGTGGYAKEMSEEFLKKQREEMTKVISESDVVITTAAIPGKKAPILVTADMAKAMAPGSIIVDLAAERGGNCELTCEGKDVTVDGVTICGPVNLPATIPYHASEMYSKNVSTFLIHLMKTGARDPDLTDEIVRDTLVCRDGQVVNERIRPLLGLESLSPATEETAADSGGGSPEPPAEASAPSGDKPAEDQNAHESQQPPADSGGEN